MGNNRKKSNTFLGVTSGILLANNFFLLALIAVLAVVLVVLIILGIVIVSNQNKPTEPTWGSVSSSVPTVPSTAPSTLPPVTDTQAPVISGTKNLEVYVGDTVSYRTGVVVSDDVDTRPALTIDNSKVDLNQPGTYPVTYTATDAAGNKSSVTIQVTVLTKPEGYVDPQVIYAKADAILSQFIKPGMTDRQKAEAVYVWTRRSVHLTYGSAPAGFVHEEADWLQTAYQLLNKDVIKGDCFYFFAVQKLLLQRLNIPTIDCEKIYDGNSHHYWLLVSVDGGKSYYHFDNVWSKQLCLVTDAELDAFSAAIESNPFNRDKSKYPATPTEKLPAGQLPWEDPAILAAKP